MNLPFLSSPPPFRGQVVVITGASAGVGRATAQAFARAGARVGLLGRDADALEQTRAEIEASGAQAVCVPTDVADADAVFAAAARVEQALGPISVWVNNAMATVFSPVQDLTPDEVRRITEVTYLGCVYGTLAALQGMRQHRRGVIVQVGSALAYRGIPLQAGYCAAKHAIRGFSDSLRAELLHANSPIGITTVHLPAINTPQFDWARTHRDSQPRPLAPIYQPEAAARAILHATLHPKREYWLGSQTPLTILGNMLAPGLMDRIVARKAVGGQDSGRPLAPGRQDNLMRPVHGTHRTQGSFVNEAEGRDRGLLVSGGVARTLALATVGLAFGLIGAAIGARRGHLRRSTGALDKLRQRTLPSVRNRKSWWRR